MKNKYAIIGWITGTISCLLLIAAAVTLFTGWITVSADRDDKNYIKSEMNDFKDTLAKADDNLTELKYYLEREGLDISAKKALRELKSLYAIAKDLSLSPSECIQLPSTVNTLGEFVEDWGDTDAELGYTVIKWWSIILAGLFYGILAVSVLALLLHILRKGASGYFLTFLYILLFGAFLFAVVITNQAITDIMSHEFEDSFLRITVMPYIALACSLASSILWSVTKRFKRKSAMVQTPDTGNPYAAAQYNPYMVPPTAPQTPGGAAAYHTGSTNNYTKICPNCGTAASSGTIFCVSCGIRLQ